MKPRQDAIELAAQCWCDEETSHKEMDATLAMAFAKRLEVLMQERDALKAQVDEFKREEIARQKTFALGHTEIYIRSLEEQLKSKDAQLEIAVKALEYYASKSLGETGAWGFRKKFCFDLVQTEDVEFLPEPIGEKGQKYLIGGVKAREALEQIQKMRGSPSVAADKESK